MCKAYTFINEYYTFLFVVRDYIFGLTYNTELFPIISQFI